MARRKQYVAPKEARLAEQAKAKRQDQRKERKKSLLWLSLFLVGGLGFFIFYYGWFLLPPSQPLQMQMQSLHQKALEQGVQTLPLEQLDTNGEAWNQLFILPASASLSAFEEANNHRLERVVGVFYDSRENNHFLLCYQDRRLVGYALLPAQDFVLKSPSLLPLSQQQKLLFKASTLEGQDQPVVEIQLAEEK